VKLVTITGWAILEFANVVPGTGPLSATPMNAAVDVLTPSIGRTPDEISKTYTPGWRSSGIAIFLDTSLHAAAVRPRAPHGQAIRRVLSGRIPAVAQLTLN
jgi:hypothetical protein